MERFEGMDMETTLRTLQQVIDENPDEFKNLTPADLLPFIEQKQYLASAMNTDIAMSPPHSHIWLLRKQKKYVICSVCMKKVVDGVICLKCHQVRHRHEIAHASDLEEHCELIRYYNDTNFKHIFSNKTLRGHCNTCKKTFTKKNFGKVCRWCSKKIHFNCSSEFEQCRDPMYNDLIFKNKLVEMNLSIDKNSVPLLVFVNPMAENNFGKELMIQFLMALHPMQVININVTDPIVGFKRFAKMPNFTAMVIGGDRTFAYVLKAFYLSRPMLWRAPKFRFIPLGETTELGRLFGERINYSTKSAAYIMQQLRKHLTYELNPWCVSMEALHDNKPEFNENFLFSFALGMDSDKEEAQEKKNSLWTRIVKAVTPSRPKRRFVRFTRIRRSGRRRILKKNEGPALEGTVVLKITGQEVDLGGKRYVGIVFVNCITPEDETTGSGPSPVKNRTTGEVEIYGITKYFKITRRNLEEKGTKFGQTSDVKMWLNTRMPFLADAYSNVIKEVSGHEMKEVHLTLNPPIQILAHKTEPRKRGLTRRRRNKGKKEKPGDREEFLGKLEEKLRQPNPEIRKQDEIQKSMKSVRITESKEEDDLERDKFMKEEETSVTVVEVTKPAQEDDIEELEWEGDEF